MNTRADFLVKHIEKCRICNEVWGVYSDEDHRGFELMSLSITNKRFAHEINEHSLWKAFKQAVLN